jgi:hypothetical protein
MRGPLAQNVVLCFTAPAETRPRPCQPNGVWLGCTARRGERWRLSPLALAVLSCAAPRADHALATPVAALRQLLHGVPAHVNTADTNVNISTVPQPEGAAKRRVGTRRFAAWGKRAAHSDDFDAHDDTCRARRPREKRGAARVRPRRTESAQDRVWLHGRAPRATQLVTCGLAMHERAEARGALQRAAVSATTPSWAAPRSDARSGRGVAWAGGYSRSSAASATKEEKSVSFSSSSSVSRSIAASSSGASFAAGCEIACTSLSLRMATRV